MSDGLIWEWVRGLLSAGALACVVSLALSAGACILVRSRDDSRALRDWSGVALAVALLVSCLAGILVLVWGAVG